MPEQTLEAQICEVMGVHPKKRESRDKFLARAATAAGDEAVLTAEAFDALPPVLQAWVNDAVKANADGTEIPEFPTEEEIEGDGDEAGVEAGVEAGEEEAPPPKKAKANSKAKAKTPAKKAIKEDDMSGTLAVGKAIMVKDMRIGVDDLVKALEAKGHNASRSTAMTIRYTFRHSVMVLKNLGVDIKQLEL